MSDAEPIHLEVYATFFAGKRVENLKYIGYWLLLLFVFITCRACCLRNLLKIV